METGEESQEAPVDIWKESEFKELRIAVIRSILIHPIHQQLSERMVQTAALTAQTNVEEDRPTNIAISRTTIVLPSNQAVLIERNETLIKEGKPSIDRDQGRHQLASQLNFICKFFNDSKRAKKRFGDAEYQRHLRELSSKGKQSESNRASNMESFARAKASTLMENGSIA